MVKHTPKIPQYVNTSFLLSQLSELWIFIFMFVPSSMLFQQFLRSLLSKNHLRIYPRIVLYPTENAPKMRHKNPPIVSLVGFRKFTDLVAMSKPTFMVLLHNNISRIFFSKIVILQ